jgi:regulation of enolase protein 1 (concanavalin A-like superfamily)
MLQWRAERGRGSQADNALRDPALEMVPPGKLLLRLRRRGNEVQGEYSRDGGKSFRPAGKPAKFAPPLQSTLYVGLAITSHNEGQLSEAKFSDLQVVPYGHP